MANYAIVNTELMAGTDVRTLMRSFRYGTGTGESFVPADIQNGSVVVVTDTVKENKRTEYDLWYANAPAKTANINDLILVTTPELMYDPRLEDKHEFVNVAGRNAVGMNLRKDDIFGVTIEALTSTATPKPGDGIYLDGTVKLVASATAVTGATKVGKIIDVRNRIDGVYYNILVG